MQKRTYEDNDNLARICRYLWDTDRDKWCEVSGLLYKRTGRADNPLGLWTEDERGLIDYWVKVYL